MHALITGAGSGIGRETARAFVASRADVVATDIDADGLAKLHADAKSCGGKLRTVAGDLTDPSFVSHLLDTSGELDLLVNCAGWVKHAPFLASDPADWEKVYAVN